MKIRSTRHDDTRVIAPNIAAMFLAARKEANLKMKEGGFPPLACPPGYFLDVPEVSQQASRHADAVRNRESLRQKMDVPVEYTVSMIGDDIVSMASWWDRRPA